MRPSVLLALALVPVFAAVLRRMPPDALPQRAEEKDVLTVVFGGAREEIGASMLRKADSYFHGGVDIDCHAGQGEGHEGHAHRAARCASHAEDLRGFDPWRWIDVRVRAPQVDRHLEGAKAVELMPWLWAAVRADPHNIEVWRSAVYVAGSLMRDETLAKRLIDDAAKSNPDSAEIAFEEGRFHYRAGDWRLAVKSFGRAKEILDRGGRVEGNLKLRELLSVYLGKLQRP